MCWRRIPTDRSGRSVRESDRMLHGSAHAVPTHEDVHKMCIHVPGGAALQEPAGGGPRTRLEHRRGARASPPTQQRRRRRRRRRHAASAESLGRKVVRTPPRRNGSQKCWRRIPTETRERPIRESDIDWVFTRRSETL